MRNVRDCAIVVLFTAALTGCGGGGGATATAADDEPLAEQPAAATGSAEGSATPPAEDPPDSVVLTDAPAGDAAVDDVSELLPPEETDSDTEGEPATDAQVPPPAPMPDNLPLPCLTPERMDSVRADVSSIGAAYSGCESDLAAATSHLDLTTAQQKAAFAMLLAHAMAPYGQSNASQLADLLAEDFLDCDNYSLLSGQFMIRLGLPMEDWLMAGFDGGAVGNHAQVFVTLDGRSLLLDPTIGLVADVTYAELVSGTPVPVERMAWSYHWDDPEILAYSVRVIAAVRDGSYRVSDQLYLRDQSTLYPR